jgi:hypothetical protein
MRSHPWGGVAVAASSHPGAATGGRAMDLEEVERRILEQQRRAAALTALAADLARQRTLATPAGLDAAVLTRLLDETHAALAAVKADLRRGYDERRDLRGASGA